MLLRSCLASKFDNNKDNLRVNSNISIEDCPIVSEMLVKCDLSE